MVQRCYSGATYLISVQFFLHDIDHPQWKGTSNHFRHLLFFNLLGATHMRSPLDNSCEKSDASDKEPSSIISVAYLYETNRSAADLQQICFGKKGSSAD